MSIIVGIGVGVGIVISVFAITYFLRMQRREDQGWSLSSAMSEVIGYDKDGNARYISSSSRFVALFGFILIFWIYAGIGLTVVLNGGVPPDDLKSTEGFLMFGLAMFAPYIANQAKAALIGLGKGVPTDLAAKPDKAIPPEGGVG